MTDSFRDKIVPVLTILAECQVKRPQQPSEWIIAALRARYDKKGSSSERISPNRATSDIAREVAERLERKAQPGEVTTQRRTAGFNQVELLCKLMFQCSL